MNNSYRTSAGPLVLFAVAIFVFQGAGCSKTMTQEGHDGEPLTALGSAYLRATQAMNRAPKEAAELTPYLAPGQDLASLLVSPADKKPYVILWGIDPRTGMEIKPLVVGYEAEGMRGARFVFHAMGVSLMSDEDFAEAKFPAGHAPPKNR